MFKFTRFGLVAAVITIVAISLMQIALAQGDKAAAIQKWEYRTATSMDELKQLGEEGWEFVALEPRMTYVLRNDPRNTERLFFLKRPK
jgi:hypothetical protein